MEFNIQKYLTENKLTGQSQMREDDNTELTLHTGDESGDLDQDDSGFSDDDSSEPEDTWNKPEPDDSAQFEKEPTTKDVKQQEPALGGIHKKQAQLQALETEKDALLMQLKSNIISLDQYKEKIGNIPAQLKKLRADIEQAMNVTVDNDSEENI
jgi:hypothetical protein